MSELNVDLLASKRARTDLAARAKSPAREPDTHHGDLRKGAYLRRRADYRMQQDLGNKHRCR
jgi:hypothetical protein